MSATRSPARIASDCSLDDRRHLGLRRHRRRDLQPADAVGRLEDRVPGRLRRRRDRLFGRGSPAWGEQDQGFNTNGNGLLFPMADGIFNPRTARSTSRRLGRPPPSSPGKCRRTSRSTRKSPTPASSTTATRRRLERSSPKATAWWVGAVFDWSPVKNLDFALDAIYELSHQSTPVGWTTRRQRPFHNNAGRLQWPHPRRPLVLSERAIRLQISAPERKLRGFLFSACQRSVRLLAGPRHLRGRRPSAGGELARRPSPGL